MSSLDDDQNLPEDDNSVGYGRPPKSTRFKKGESGNPRGRPKGSLSISTLFIKAMNERVVINENRQRKAVPKIVAFFKQLMNKAVAGDPRAQRLVLELLYRIEQQQQSNGGQGTTLNQFDHEIIEALREEMGNMAPEVATPNDEVEDERGDQEEGDMNEQPNEDSDRV